MKYIPFSGFPEHTLEYTELTMGDDMYFVLADDDISSSGVEITEALRVEKLGKRRAYATPVEDSETLAKLEKMLVLGEDSTGPIEDLREEGLLEE